MNMLSPGTRTLEYVARVQYRGEATAPAPRAEPMYDPGDYAFGVGSRIPVR